MADTRGRRIRDGVIAGVCAFVFVCMVGLAFAAVPFYRAFCQATGFDGTPRRAETAAGVHPIDRTILVRYDTNVRSLPWKFLPLAGESTVRIGATSMAYFTVENLSNSPLTGRAVYNISPESAAGYFLKLQCFCFSDQTVPAHTKETFPVVFYVDPKFATDTDTSALKELTLSYTFFPAPDAKAEAQRRG